jgi:ATP-dependent Clp protease ATP-binding subunit ClpA
MSAQSYAFHYNNRYVSPAVLMMHMWDDPILTTIFEDAEITSANFRSDIIELARDYEQTGLEPDAYEPYDINPDRLLMAMYNADGTEIGEILNLYIPQETLVRTLRAINEEQGHPEKNQRLGIGYYKSGAYIMNDDAADNQDEQPSLNEDEYPLDPAMFDDTMLDQDQIPAVYEPKRPVVLLGESLREFCVDLSQKAENGKIDPVIGRSEEIERALQVFSRRSKNNPLLVGHPGVGKTAIAEGLALKIAEGEVPNSMKQDYIISLSMGDLVAGTRFRGDFEDRLKKILKEIEQLEKDLVEFTIPGQRAPRVRLFIDGIHTLVGAGATGGGAMDASNILKPKLANGEISILGATTFAEYKKFMGQDKALMRRFQKINIEQPSVEETAEILKGLRHKFEAHHQVSYTDEALELAAKLAAQYITDRQLPDSAIDVIDEAAALESLKDEDEKKEIIGTAEVEVALAKLAGIPQKTVSQNDTEKLQSLEETLKEKVFGQDAAIKELASAIKLSRAGLREPNKPMGNYLFTGPTGVGKTEVCKQLASALNVELLRFDMSEYMEKHAVSRLIGAPPGYVGFDQGGLLTDAVDQNKHAILLLDEIEKAHPDMYNILLQVMDNGVLTDNNGKKVDFRNVIVVMTSNAGAAEQEKATDGVKLGFGTSSKADDAADDASEVINKLFAPEFRNRLDAMIRFERLPQNLQIKLVDKFIGDVETQLADRNVTIGLDDASKLWLSEKGYDPKMGARPMGRVIQEYIKKPLSEEILFGALKDGGTVNIRFNAEAEGKTDEAGLPLSPLTFTFNQESGAAANTPEILQLPGPTSDRKPS